MIKLNKKIFDLDTNKMFPEVRNACLDVVDEFINQITDKTVKSKLDIKDIILVGSNASYNYTKYSDLDIHIVVDLAEICKCCPEIVQSLFNAEKQRFNITYDISIKGINAEVYVEDIRSSTVSNGIYSILNNEWIKFPKIIVPPSVNIDEELSKYLDKVFTALSSDDLYTVKSTIDELYLLRKNSLSSEGEYSKGNLVFKEIRNRGLLDELKDEMYELTSKELSLESVESE